MLTLVSNDSWREGSAKIKMSGGANACEMLWHTNIR